MAEEREDIISEDDVFEDVADASADAEETSKDAGPANDLPAGSENQKRPSEGTAETAVAKQSDGEVSSSKKARSKAKKTDKRKSSGKKEKDSGVIGYVKGISAEMKRTTWPKRREVLSWSLVVTAVIALFALLMFVMDNLIATPIMFAISGLSVDDGFGLNAILLTVAFFFTGIGTAIGVLLHAGGDSNGLSDNLSTQLTGGSAIAEKNLDRITIVMAILFAIVLALMMVFFPTGTIAGA